LFSAEGPSGPPSEAMHSKTFGLYGVCVKQITKSVVLHDGVCYEAR